MSCFTVNTIKYNKKVILLKFKHCSIITAAMYLMLEVQIDGLTHLSNWKRSCLFTMHTPGKFSGRKKMEYIKIRML